MVPIVVTEVVEQGGGGVGGLGGGLPREAQPQPVFGLKRPPSRGVRLWLAVAQPQKRRSGHADGGRVGEPLSGVLTEPAVGGELLAGAGVGPEDGGSRWAPAVVGEDDAVHLSRETNRRDLRAALPDGGPRGLDDSVPP